LVSAWRWKIMIPCCYFFPEVGRRTLLFDSHLHGSATDACLVAYFSMAREGIAQGVHKDAFSHGKISDDDS
jgi:hypothetical protein